MISLVLLTIASIEDEDNRNFAIHIYQSYDRLIYSELNKYPGLHSSVNDVFHEVIIKLYPHLDDLRIMDKNQLANYIISAAQNAAKDHLRKEKRHRCCTLIDDLDSLEEQVFSLDERLIAIENNEAFFAAWKELDEDTQLLLRMKLVLRKPDTEIAKTFNIATTSVHTLITRAKKKFIKIYRKQNP